MIIFGSTIYFISAAEFINEDYGFSAIIPNIFNGIFLAILGLAAFDSMKHSFDKKKSQEDLGYTVKYIERLQQHGFFESSKHISENLFKDIFKHLEKDSKSPINSAYIGNLEVFGKSLQESSAFSHELTNLKCLERLYSEIFQTALNATIKESNKETVLNNYFKPYLNRKSEVKLCKAQLRIATYINTWLEVLIKLSSFIDKNHYLQQADLVSKWSDKLFATQYIDIFSPSALNFFLHLKMKRLPGDRSYDFILQRIKFYRLKGNLHHEQVRITTTGKINIKNIEDTEKEYRKSLSILYCLMKNEDISDPLPIENRAFLDCTDYADECSNQTFAKILHDKLFNDKPKYFSWGVLEECSDVEKSLKNFDNDDNYLNSIYEGNVALEKLFGEFSIETALVYESIALNRVRYVEHYIDSENDSEIVPFKENDLIINKAFGMMQSLLSYEQSWKHCIKMYDNMGIYFRVKGEYLKSVNKNKSANYFYDSAISIHKLVSGHLTDPTFTNNLSLTCKKTDDSSPIDYLIYLRNLINLSKAQLCLYKVNENEQTYMESQKNLKEAICHASKTGNYIYRARAYGYLAELYSMRKEYNEALLSYFYSIETFSKLNYPAFHHKICNRLANFYKKNEERFDEIHRVIFAKSFNLCLNFSKKGLCKIHLCNNYPNPYLELFKRAPDQCKHINDCDAYSMESDQSTIDRVFE
ncbi:hypothetical protein QA601_07695 [Chitinispirillales bacterium ANBcel5]|uniref:hypothetical protein n=1 Tax=Cellulosispirillum alkaliphilum TaxID=3039283 RepID=UPI002A5120A6|nr:hypothetical protein [Chitinispirillales bacterium ANBcel5]